MDMKATPTGTVADTVEREVAAPGQTDVRRWAAGPRLRALLHDQGLVLILLILMVLSATLSPYFLSVSNFLTIGSAASVLGIMAITQTYLIIAGGFDVSVGSVLSFTSVLIGLLVSAGVNVWMASMIALLTGGAIGALNGFIVLKLKVNPLITTLGTLSIFSGLAYIVSHNQAWYVSDVGFSFLGAGKLAGLPVPLLLFLLIFVAGLFLERVTRFGRAIYAIGGNREAARLAGIRVEAVPFWLYVMSGLSGGFAGVLTTSALAASGPQVGEAYLLSVVTAVILGGASLAGGRGSVVGTLIAVFVLGVLQNGFALLEFTSSAQNVGIGVVLIVAVLMDQAAQALGKKAPIRGAPAGRAQGTARP